MSNSSKAVLSMLMALICSFFFFSALELEIYIVALVFCLMMGGFAMVGLHYDRK
jgi:hypothetical protein